MLFKLFDDIDGAVAEVASGWMVTAAKSEVEWPRDPDRHALVRSPFGARRFAFNWGLGRVKADLDARTTDPGHAVGIWPHSGRRGTGLRMSSPLGGPPTARSANVTWPPAAPTC